MFKPTSEQKVIFDRIQNGTGNILIDAKAGSGKTTTLIEAVKLLPEEKSVTFLAFNKHIQLELKEKLPLHVFCYTTYGLGRGAIHRKYKNIEFDEYRVKKLIKKHLQNWNISKGKDLSTYLQNIENLVNLCRLTLTSGKYIEYLAIKHDIKLGPYDTKRINGLLRKLLDDKKTYDFTDMVFLPVVDPKIWLFQQDYVFVDECQDLNRAQQEMIKKVVKRDKKTGKQLGRIISVGDKFQSIYGFAGADVNSFDMFSKIDNTEILPLSISFRCGKEIVKEAQKIVKGIYPLENADDGVVDEDGDVLYDSKSGDFVLSRKTLPLVSLFYDLLTERKKATIKGKDLGISLLKMIGDAKTPKKMFKNADYFLNRLRANLKGIGYDDYVNHPSYIALVDKIRVLIFLIQQEKTVDNVKREINEIFSDKLEGIILSTVHKAKGMEADNVFIIKPNDMPLGNVSREWMKDQENNLKYVAITRARKKLIYDYKWEESAETAVDVDEYLRNL